MVDDRPVPNLFWKHVSMGVIMESVHIHIQEAKKYRGLRSIWTIDTKTMDRKTRYFIKGKEYPTLNDAIDGWKEQRKRMRVRL